MRKKFEDLHLEKIGVRRKNVNAEASGSAWLPRNKIETHLADGMVENFHLRRRGTALDFAVSVVGHSLVVALLILVPLCFTHAIDLPQLEKTFLIAPPPPPPAPPPAAVHLIRRPPKSFFNQGKLIAPKFIPKQIAQVKEEAPPPETAMSGETGGVLGGVPGGQWGGVLGGILGGNHQVVPTPPPPAPAARKGPYRVGGKLQAPQLIKQVQPIYPILAKQARVQGDVVIDSVIDQQGEVTQMKVVSGSPLLVEAAIQALEQWRYRPTLLNGQPVPVEMFVTVHFQLG